MSTNTVKLHRVLRASPEKVYKAFLDPDAMAKWLPLTDLRERCTRWMRRSAANTRCRSRTLGSGQSHSFGGEYLELVPNKRIRNTDRFDDPNMPGEMITTVDLREVSVGTEVNVVQEGIPEAIPAEACYLGWQESLTLLAQLVEANIPSE